MNHIKNIIVNILCLLPWVQRKRYYPRFITRFIFNQQTRRLQEDKLQIQKLENSLINGFARTDAKLAALDKNPAIQTQGIYDGVSPAGHATFREVKPNKPLLALSNCHCFSTFK